MHKVGSVLGVLVVVALLPAAAALLQGCHDCGSSRNFELDLDAEGVYRVCEGGEHVFEQLEAERDGGGAYSGVYFEISADTPSALLVEYGANDLVFDGGVVTGDTVRQGCNVVQDNDPLVVRATSKVEYELLLSSTDCPDE